MNEGQSKDKGVFEMISVATENGFAFNPVKRREEKTYDFLYKENSGEEWHDDRQEGQLAIDVINKDEDIIVISTMAGANADKIEVYIHNDLLTIRGERPRLAEESEDMAYLYQECFWGKFSRTVVLPVDVKGDCARAEYKNGVLTIVIPKQKKDSRVRITIVED